MIGYLEGTFLKKDDEKILLLVNHVGYEILLPAFVRDSLSAKKTGEELSLFIYYYQTERQPKPVLIGFNIEAEKEFFQMFITVEAIGPMKAVKALTLPVREIARAIEEKNAKVLSGLKGIGSRTAQKIIATLCGKMGKFALISKSDEPQAEPSPDYVEVVLDVLVNQLGHRQTDAMKLIKDALSRNKDIDTPEDLFDEVYRGEIEA